MGSTTAEGAEVALHDPHREVPDVVWQRLYAAARREVQRFGRQDTLNATALVNEAWLRLADGSGHWQSHEHYIATMARVMRHLLIDHLRQKAAVKRGGDQQRITVTHLDERSGEESRVFDLLALDAALGELRALDPRLERVAELRFFGGLSVEETAAVLGVSTATIKRDARTARAFLAVALGE